MMDWYLGQAGFGEQLERYGDAYWRQLGGTLLWAFIVIWALLVFVTIVVVLAGRADVNEAGRERAFDRMLTATRIHALVPRVTTARPVPPSSEERPGNKVVPPKVA